MAFATAAMGCLWMPETLFRAVGGGADAIVDLDGDTSLDGRPPYRLAVLTYQEGRAEIGCIDRVAQQALSRVGFRRAAADSVALR